MNYSEQKQTLRHREQADGCQRGRCGGTGIKFLKVKIKYWRGKDTLSNVLLK